MSSRPKSPRTPRVKDPFKRPRQASVREGASMPRSGKWYSTRRPVID